MGAKHRYIDRRDWKRVTRRKSAALYLSDGAFAHRLDILAVTEPGYGSFGDAKVRIVDAGWTWLSWMRPDFPWALTAMRDETGRWTQWYFDIVSAMGRDADGRAWFDDCYLDVVVLPDGSTTLLDEDELREALASGDVSEEQARRAKEAAQALLAAFPDGIGALCAFTEALFSRFR